MKSILVVVGYIAGGIIFVILSLLAVSLASGYGIRGYIYVALMFLYIVPFPLNYYLAVTREKNPFLMLVITIPLSWLVTLALAMHSESRT